MGAASGQLGSQPGLEIFFLAHRHVLRGWFVTGITKSIALDGRPYRIACSQIDIGNAATSLTERMTQGVLQADGRKTPEDRLDERHVARAVVHMAELPLEANILTMTIMATNMPFVGRG